MWRNVDLASMDGSVILISNLKQMKTEGLEVPSGFVYKRKMIRQVRQ